MDRQRAPTVTVYDEEGDIQTHPGQGVGTFTLSAVSPPKAMAPGDILCRVLRQVPGS